MTGHLTYKKRILTYALCGAAGFGVGGAIGATTSVGPLFFVFHHRSCRGSLDRITLRQTGKDYPYGASWYRRVWCCVAPCVGLLGTG